MAIGLYILYMIAEPNPSSAIDNIDNILVNTVFNPKYSSPNVFKNIDCTTTPNTIFRALLISATIIFFADFCALINFSSFHICL